MKTQKAKKTTKSTSIKQPGKALKQRKSRGMGGSSLGSGIGFGSGTFGS